MNLATSSLPWYFPQNLDLVKAVFYSLQRVAVWELQRLRLRVLTFHYIPVWSMFCRFGVNIIATISRPISHFCRRFDRGYLDEARFLYRFDPGLVSRLICGLILSMEICLVPIMNQSFMNLSSTYSISRFTWWKRGGILFTNQEADLILVIHPTLRVLDHTQICHFLEGAIGWDDHQRR